MAGDGFTAIAFSICSHRQEMELKLPQLFLERGIESSADIEDTVVKLLKNGLEMQKSINNFWVKSTLLLKKHPNFWSKDTFMGHLAMQWSLLLAIHWACLLLSFHQLTTVHSSILFYEY